MNGFSFAHISDLHLPFEPRLTPVQRFSKRQLSVWSWRRRRALHRSEILDALAADLRAQGVDHILVTGDITNFSLPGEFVQAAAWLSALAPAECISLVPGNHDALVRVPSVTGLNLWRDWMRRGAAWPFLHRLGRISLIGLNSAVPTAPLLAQGRLGQAQLERLEGLLGEEGARGQTRVLMLHHPVAAGAVPWRKALSDAGALRAVLRRAGAELVLHGHAHDARLDGLPGPREPIPSLCVPSSSAVPNPRDEAARWHRLVFSEDGADRGVTVEVRRWSVQGQAFARAGTYELCLPRASAGISGQNIAA